MSESDKSGKPELTAKRTAAEIVGSALSRKIDEVEALKARIAELEKMLEQFTYYGLIHTVNGVVPVDYDSHEDLIKKAKLIFQKQP